MAEAARRLRETGGSDVVRRLIARPIRLDPPRVPARPSFTAPVVDRIDAFADAAPDIEAFEAAEIEDETLDDASEQDDVVARLQTEVAVMKAILMAERAEAASLRAQIAQQVEPDPIGAEARATRERWAAMVDRLLLSPR